VAKPVTVEEESDYSNDPAVSESESEDPKVKFQKARELPASMTEPKAVKKPAGAKAKPITFESNSDSNSDSQDDAPIVKKIPRKRQAPPPVGSSAKVQGGSQGGSQKETQVPTQETVTKRIRLPAEGGVKDLDFPIREITTVELNLMLHAANSTFYILFTVFLLLFTVHLLFIYL
jgi:hypothetical protein